MAMGIGSLIGGMMDMAPLGFKRLLHKYYEKFED